MIDIRYHLASMVAIFFALGLGMLAGVQLAEDGRLAREQARLIEQIEAGLQRVRDENRRLSEQLAAAEGRLAAERDEAEAAVARLAAGRLAGVTVRIVPRDGAESYEERVREALLRAGARFVPPTGADGSDDGGPDPITVVLAGAAPREEADGSGGSDPPAEGDGDLVPPGEEGGDVTAETDAVWVWPGAAPPETTAAAVTDVETPWGLAALVAALQERTAAGRGDGTADASGAASGAPEGRGSGP